MAGKYSPAAIGSIGYRFAFWALVAMVFALPRIAAGADARQTALAALVQWWTWALLTPLIFMADDLMPFSRRQWLARLLAHLAAGSCLTLLYVLLFSAFQRLVDTGPARPFDLAAILLDAMNGLYTWSFLVYCMIVGSRHVYLHHRHFLQEELRFERLERSFTEARLQALRSQLDPHFLFNTLNTISAQLQADPKLARQMIEHLGDLLRLSLDPESRDEVALSDELDFLDLYLSIQKIRFGDKLRVTLHIAPDIRRAAVPSLFIQPLVENAIRHGVSRRAAGGAIDISARRLADTLEITVRDDGVGLPSDWSPQRPAGLGLRLTRERIAGFHAEGATQLTIQNHPDGGVKVTIHMPLRLMEQSHAAS